MPKFFLDNEQIFTKIINIDKSELNTLIMMHIEFANDAIT
jgi:hypothetical protein